MATITITPPHSFSPSVEDIVFRVSILPPRIRPSLKITLTEAQTLWPYDFPQSNANTEVMEPQGSSPGLHSFSGLHNGNNGNNSHRKWPLFLARGPCYVLLYHACEKLQINIIYKPPSLCQFHLTPSDVILIS